MARQHRVLGDTIVELSEVLFSRLGGEEVNSVTSLGHLFSNLGQVVKSPARGKIVIDSNLQQSYGFKMNLAFSERVMRVELTTFTMAT